MNTYFKTKQKLNKTRFEGKNTKTNYLKCKKRKKREREKERKKTENKNDEFHQKLTSLILN